MKYTNTCRDPFDFIKDLKKRYRQGLTLPSPDLAGRSLSAEDLLSWDVDLGECENPLVLALVACRDPMVTMSMAATCRFSPMTLNHKLLSGVFTIVGDVTRHTDVKDCVHVMVKEKFTEQGTQVLRNKVIGKIIEKREQYRQQIRSNLAKLIEGHISPEVFTDDFFMGMGQLNLKHSAYTKMVVDFLLSNKFRPKVKILMLENLYRMPREVRMQVVVDLCNAPKVGHNEAMRDELICILQDRPALLQDPLNQNEAPSLGHPYPRSFKQKMKDMEDPAFITAQKFL